MRLLRPAVLIAFTAVYCSAQIRLDAGSNTMLRSPDIHFAMDVQQAGLGAVEYAKVAEQKKVPTLQQLGNGLAAFYSSFNKRAEVLVLRDKTMISQVVSGKDVTTCNKLRRLTGPEFEKHWTGDLIKSQKRALKLFKRESKKGKDEHMRQLALEALPALEEQIAKLKSLHP